MKATDFQKGIISYVEIAQAMIDGLKNSKKMKDFKVSMDTYGGNKEGVCYGCAATCTMMELTGKKVKAGEFGFRSKFSYFTNGLTHRDVYLIESVVDKFRLGCKECLAEYCGVGLQDQKKIPITNWLMATHNWEEELPKVQKHVDKVMEIFNLEWA